MKYLYCKSDDDECASLVIVNVDVVVVVVNVVVVEVMSFGRSRSCIIKFRMCRFIGFVDMPCHTHTIYLCERAK